MKTAAVLIVTVLVSAMCFSVEPQTSPKPLLVDEHPVLPCDESLARLDYFFAELQNDFGSNGFIVISNKPEGRRNSVFRQALIEVYARFRNFDSSRLKIVRSNSNEDMKIQLWRVPLGATEPSIEHIDMSDIIPATVKPFIFTRDEAWDDGICPSINERRILVEFLKQNPSARINIVSRDGSAAVAQRRALNAARRISRGGQINRKRIRIFVVKTRTIPNTDQPLVEYWYLP